MEVTPLLPLLALALSALSILLLRRPAVAWGLADIPGGRKQHQGTVPLTGGLGVFIGFLLVQPLLAVPFGELMPLYVGLVALVACGVIDDARDMRSTVKLAVQLAVAALMVLWGQQVLGYLGRSRWWASCTWAGWRCPLPSWRWRG
jgi:UDP-GlcNAc:undecaprenyl-phosphate/decaprenyl-phosphate GlcNAc-1-phosphate transferase